MKHKQGVVLDHTVFFYEKKRYFSLRCSYSMGLFDRPNNATLMEYTFMPKMYVKMSKINMFKMDIIPD